MTIVLTQQERRIFDIVLQACEHLHLTCQVRVAGGWVRDKLLGLESHDIDFALDNMMGVDFANAVTQYLKSTNNKTSSIGVIKVNPDQSKHLETATFKIDDVPVDVNNFREEIYHENSRIPEIKLSTAQEDALRRDFTVNALFYNIHTRQVEDYVGGLGDLERRLLRTPRPPLKTFSDDPLRILRAARFAGRFNLTVVDDIVQAASNPSTRADLASKVSRERIGIEISKMLHEWQSAVTSIGYLCTWCLRSTCFAMPPAHEPMLEEGCAVHLFAIDGSGGDDDASVTATCMLGMRLAHARIEAVAVSAASSSSSSSSADPYVAAVVSSEGASALLLSAFLLPYFGFKTALKKNRWMALSQFVVRESLKLSMKEADTVHALHNSAHTLFALSRSWYMGRRAQGVEANRDQILIKTASELRSLGTLSYLVLELLPVFERVFASSSSTNQQQQQVSDDEMAVAQYVRWVRTETPFVRACVWEMKPLYNGKQLQELLQLPAGPHLAQYNEKLIEWQVLQLCKSTSTSTSTSLDPALALQHLRSLTIAVHAMKK